MTQTSLIHTERRRCKGSCRSIRCRLLSCRFLICRSLRCRSLRCRFPVAQKSLIIGRWCGKWPMTCQHKAPDGSSPPCTEYKLIRMWFDFMCVTSLLHVCHITHSCVSHHSFIHASFIQMKKTHALHYSCVLHKSFTCLTYSCVLHESFICLSCVLHKSFICLSCARHR